MAHPAAPRLAFGIRVSARRRLGSEIADAVTGYNLLAVDADTRDTFGRVGPSVGLG
jgi:hypothetical protein